MKHDQPDRAARPREVSNAAGRLSRDGYPGKSLLWEQQARLDKATGGGMKRVERITGDAAQVDYLRAFTFYLHIRNLNWNAIWEYEPEEMWEGQVYTLWKFLPTQYTMADWENYKIMYHGGTFYGFENTIRSAKMFASEDVELGHGLLGERGGVFWAPDPAVAAGYSPGHNVFGDGMLHKIVWQLHCKDGYRTARKPRTSHCNEQSAYAEKGCKVMGAWFGHNTELLAGGLRFLCWAPGLESTMPGWGEDDTVVIDEQGRPCIEQQQARAAKARPVSIAKAVTPPLCTRCSDEMHSLDNTWICPPCGATVRKTGTRSAAGCNTDCTGDQPARRLHPGGETAIPQGPGCCSV